MRTIQLKTVSQYVYNQLCRYMPHVLYTGNAVGDTEVGVTGSSNVQQGKGKAKSYYNPVQISVTG
jgi:hypothetical protein